MTPRRKLYACGIIIAALSCVPTFAANSWSQFRDPDGAFTVDFPAPPTVKTLNDPTEPVVECVFDGGTVSMLIIVGDFTGKNINESKAVDAAVNGMSRNHKLQSSKIDQLDGQRGRYVIFKDADGTELSGRIFLLRDVCIKR
jgi:hypothetical protein